MRARNRQQGITTVEFSIVGGLLLVIIFGIVEFGRLIFTLNVLQESARRGARVAAVCRFRSDGPVKAALFAPLPGLTTSNVDVQYFDEDGSPAGAAEDVSFVRVSVSGYRFRIYLPLVDREFPLRTFTSTLPAESLGVPKIGEPAACYEEGP